MSIFSLFNSSLGHKVIISSTSLGMGISIFQQMEAVLKNRNLRELKKILNKTGASKHFFASYALKAANMGWLDGLLLLLKKENDGVYFLISPILNERGRVLVSRILSFYPEDISCMILLFGRLEFEEKKKHVDVFLEEKGLRACIKEPQIVKEKLKI